MQSPCSRESVTGTAAQQYRRGCGLPGLPIYSRQRGESAAVPGRLSFTDQTLADDAGMVCAPVGICGCAVRWHIRIWWHRAHYDLWITSLSFIYI